MENFMVLVFNIGGKLCEDVNDVLKYSDREVHSFVALDVDLLSIPVLEDMAKSLGFLSYTEMNTLVENHCVDFEIYFEHSVSIPMMADGVDADGVEANCGEVNVDADCVDLDNNAGEKSSSSNDGYESAKDGAYKPPPDGYELSSDSDGGGSKKAQKKGRRKVIMTPTKKNFPKKNAIKSPTKKTNLTADHTSEGNDDGRGKGIGGVGNGEDAGCGGKKKRSRKYLGKRKQKSMPYFGPTSLGSGPNARGDDSITEVSPLRLILLGMGKN
ncbi:hypothetical protein PIB30_003586 [Stylosanthes scabra]|uniref:PB1-like domain-containing protein n=1 Tax=Stylosanthes scabra TaxID=79078 RepID=A0ABU6X3K4_9FABA|nr:hypothetical protein [Stylosanthes scabra]